MQMTSCGPKKRAPGTQRRVTLAELIIVGAILGMLAGIAIPLHANAQARARIEQVQADLQMLALGVRKYTDHMGTLPWALTARERPKRKCGSFHHLHPPAT
jgi:Tfp pilus assembly protein PilE